MNYTPWTEGPWTSENCSLDTSQMSYSYRANKFEPIGGCGCCGSPWINGATEDEAEANAHLIAAAPEMAEALQWFCDRVDAGEVRSTKTYNRFKAILAKARGAV